MEFQTTKLFKILHLLILNSFSNATEESSTNSSLVGENQSALKFTMSSKVNNIQGQLFKISNINYKKKYFL